MTTTDTMRHDSSSKRSLTARELALLFGTQAPSTPLPDITGASHHSGRIKPSDAFFALPGADHHGIEHADAALAAGASLIVSDLPHPRGIQVGDAGEALLTLGRWARARIKGPVIGVTGSAGKTTVRALLAAALQSPSSKGNLNTLHALAGRLVQGWHEDQGRPLIMEMGIDRVGEMEQLVDLIAPDIGILTAIAPSHLDGFGDVDTVAREKARLLHSVPHAFAALGAWRRLDPDLAQRTTPYALSDIVTPTDVASTEDHLWTGRMQGTPFQPELEVTAPKGIVQGRGPLPGLGRGLAESTIGTLAIATHLGFELATAFNNLQHAEFEPGRLQVHAGEGWILLDDTYNANPASMQQAIELLKQGERPLVAVLGDMRELGSEASAHHHDLGEATRDLDLVLVTGDHAADVQAGNPGAVVLTMEELLDRAAELPLRGTILVKASRSLRFERVVQTMLEQGA